MQNQLNRLSTDGQEFFTSYDEVYESFDAMGLQENLLRGIYAYGMCWQKLTSLLIILEVVLICMSVSICVILWKCEFYPYFMTGEFVSLRISSKTFCLCQGYQLIMDLATVSFTFFKLKYMNTWGWSLHLLSLFHL